MKEDREKAVEKFFNLQKKALYDIVPKGGKRVVDLPPDQHEEDGETTRKHRVAKNRKFGYKKWLIVFLTSAALIGSVAYAAVYLPRADIVVTLRQTPKNFESEIKAAVSGGDIPMQVWSETKNAELEFPASGREKVSRRARGAINVCNAFNSSPQQLVATTRFETADGFVFRADKGILVPGAIIKNRKIEPQCVNAAVTADKTGIAGNIGPVAKWTIPGFKGSPRYDGFYGVSDKPMSGGFVGEAAVPTKQDIENAKAAARKKIAEIITTAIEVRAPKDITILSGGTGFTVTKETLISETDEDGNFHYFIEAKDEKIGIRKSDIENFFIKLALKELGDEFKLASSKVDFTLKSKIGAGAGSATKEAVLDAKFSGEFVSKVEEDSIKMKAAGKREPELRTVFVSDNIQDAKIYLWPFWVKTVPKKLDRISVKINVEPLPQEQAVSE